MCSQYKIIINKINLKTLSGSLAAIYGLESLKQVTKTVIARKDISLSESLLLNNKYTPTNLMYTLLRTVGQLKIVEETCGFDSVHKEAAACAGIGLSLDIATNFLGKTLQKNATDIVFNTLKYAAFAYINHDYSKDSESIEHSENDPLENTQENELTDQSL